MEAVSTPRISSQLLNEFVNKNVMLVGKVQQLRGETAIIDAEGSVTANLNRVGAQGSFAAGGFRLTLS